MAQNDQDAAGAAPAVERAVVAIVGLGVSSIQLVRQLQREGVDYKVFTKQAFGIWTKLRDVGEEFDLVSTSE